MHGVLRLLLRRHYARVVCLSGSLNRAKQFLLMGTRTSRIG